MLLLLCSLSLASAQAHTWSSCILPLNFCQHLDVHKRLSPVQTSMLRHAQASRAPLPPIYPRTASPSTSTPTPLPTPEIPNVVHFVFGLGNQRAEFHFAYFLNVVATALILNPSIIYMHYATEPTGKWWKEAQPLLHAIKYKLADTKYTHGIYLNHYAHRADVVRLDALIKYGGVYLDLDALPLKSFDDLRTLGAKNGALMGAEKIIDPQAAEYTRNRNHYIMVSHFHEHLKKRKNPDASSSLGQEQFEQIMNGYGMDHWKLWEEFQDEYGYNFLYEDKCRDAESNAFTDLHYPKTNHFEWWEDYEFLCNAVMMSMPNSTFMKVWLDRYRYFNDTCWNCHSVWLPTHLARNIIPNDVHMLENHYPKSTFFSPGWHREDLEMLYGGGTYDFSNSYAMHMWFSSAKRIFNLETKIQPIYFIKKKGLQSILKSRKREDREDREDREEEEAIEEREKEREKKQRTNRIKAIQRHREESATKWSTYQKMIRSVIPEDLLYDFVMLSS